MTERWMPDINGKLFRCYLINGKWLDADLYDLQRGTSKW